MTTKTISEQITENNKWKTILINENNSPVFFEYLIEYNNLRQEYIDKKEEKTDDYVKQHGEWLFIKWKMNNYLNQFFSYQIKPNNSNQFFLSKIKDEKFLVLDSSSIHTKSKCNQFSMNMMILEKELIYNFFEKYEVTGKPKLNI